MLNVIRPSAKDTSPPEQNNCPVCGLKYINEYTVVPSTYLNLAVQVRECANQHSWEKQPGSIPAVPAGESSHVQGSSGPPAFENVYRPLYDTQEPVKRLFKS